MWAGQRTGQRIQETPSSIQHVTEWKLYQEERKGTVPRCAREESSIWTTAHMKMAYNFNWSFREKS